MLHFEVLVSSPLLLGVKGEKRSCPPGMEGLQGGVCGRPGGLRPCVWAARRLPPPLPATFVSRGGFSMATPRHATISLSSKDEIRSRFPVGTPGPHRAPTSLAQVRGLGRGGAGTRPAAPHSRRTRPTHARRPSACRSPARFPRSLRLQSGGSAGFSRQPPPCLRVAFQCQAYQEINSSRGDSC